MTDAGVLEVVESIEQLDFAPRCEHYITGKCDVPATWIGRVTCCAEVFLRCDEHKALADRVFPSLTWGRPHGICGRFTASLTWEPLRGGHGG